MAAASWVPFWLSGTWGATNDVTVSGVPAASATAAGLTPSVLLTVPATAAAATASAPAGSLRKDDSDVAPAAAATAAAPTPAVLLTVPVAAGAATASAPAPSLISITVSAPPAVTVYGARLAYQELIFRDAPVGYWRLGEPTGSMLDYAGTHPIPLSGSLFTRDVPGVLGTDDDGALLFDAGAGQTGAGTVLAAATNFTVEGWLNLDVGLAGEGTINNALWGSTLAGSTDTRILVRGNGLVYAGIGQTTEKIVSVIVPGLTTTGQWHHYALVRTGTKMELFVDGVSVGSRNDLNGVTTTRIAGGPGVQYSIDGTIDEIAVYDTSLTAAQLLERVAAAPNGWHNTSQAALPTPAVTLTVPAVAGTATASAPAGSLRKDDTDIVPAAAATAAAPTPTVVFAIGTVAGAAGAAAPVPGLAEVVAVPAGAATASAPTPLIPSVVVTSPPAGTAAGAVPAVSMVVPVEACQAMATAPVPFVINGIGVGAPPAQAAAPSIDHLVLLVVPVAAGAATASAPASVVSTVEETRITAVPAAASADSPSPTPVIAVDGVAGTGSADAPTPDLIITLDATVDAEPAAASADAPAPEPAIILEPLSFQMVAVDAQIPQLLLRPVVDSAAGAIAGGLEAIPDFVIPVEDPPDAVVALPTPVIERPVLLLAAAQAFADFPTPTISRFVTGVPNGKIVFNEGPASSIAISISTVRPSITVSTASGVGIYDEKRGTMTTSDEEVETMVVSQQ